MQTIETKVYDFDELSAEAKEKAREWYREGMFDMDDWAEATIDDAKTMGALMGIDIDKVFYSGFYSQGDGACFEGSYTYAKGGFTAVKENAPLDTELHDIAYKLQKLQRKNFYFLEATVKHSGNYYHELCTNISIDNEGANNSFDGEDLKQLLREFMMWIYKQLRNEYEYMSSDEQVDETIRSNTCTFTENGSRFG